MEPSPRGEFRVTLSTAGGSVVGDAVVRDAEDAIDERCQKRYQWGFKSNARIVSARIDSCLGQNENKDHDGNASNQVDVSWNSLEMRNSSEEMYLHGIDISLRPSPESQCVHIVLELDTRSLESSTRENELALDENIDYNQEGRRIYSPPCICLQPGFDKQSMLLTALEWRLSNELPWSKIFQYWSSNDPYEYNSSSWVRVFPHQMSFYKSDTARTSGNAANRLYEFGKELFGNIKISNASISGDELMPDMAIKLYVGETFAEVMNDDEDHFEQCTSLSYYDDDGYGTSYYMSEHPLAFRFVRIVGEEALFRYVFNNGKEAMVIERMLEVECLIRSPRISMKGNFSSAGSTDEHQLDSEIWQTSVHTLQSCMYQNFIVDGIKRDRLPWAGDLAVSIMSNAYSFADSESIRCTLTVLGSCGIDRLLQLTKHDGNIEQQKALVNESHVNGIVDFSLWYFISHWLYQRYFGDAVFLRQEWAKIKLRLFALIKYGVETGKEYLTTYDDDWVFIDWSSSVHKPTALQILWWWALESVTLLGDMMLQIDVNNNDNDTQDFVNNIRDAQSRLELYFLGKGDIQASYSRHGHILGVLSGLNARLVDKTSGSEWWSPDTSDEYWHALLKVRKLDSQSRQALLRDELDQVGTPFMKHLECLAICRLGRRSNALDRVRNYWGGMLSTGATTFYEAFEVHESVDDIAKFYDRPFARSLCHAWGSGPCALIPEILLGVRPLADGWKVFQCDPLIECPTDVVCSLQMKHGTIEVKLDSKHLRLVVPKCTSMVLMEKVYEPGSHSIPRKTLLSLESVRQWSQKYRHGVHQPKHVILANPEIPGCGDIEMTDVPTIYQLPGNASTYYMSFVGFNGSCYQSFTAESTDLISWSRIRLAMAAEGFDRGGVVLGAYLYENYNITAPRVLKQFNGKFYSLYGAYSKQGGYEIDPGHQGLASSDDGLFWTREEDESILTVLGPGTVGDWEKSSIYQPWLVEHDGLYYNFYNAKQMPQWVEQIGLATSTDLRAWTRHEENPILRVSNDGFDKQFCADAKVFFDDKVGHWVMFYFGVGKGGAHIMIAYSKDLIHWVRDPEPLYYAGDNPSGLDKSYAHKISIVYANDKFYLYYCAVGDDGRGIGLITIDLDDESASELG